MIELLRARPAMHEPRAAAATSANKAALYLDVRERGRRRRFTVRVVVIVPRTARRLRVSGETGVEWVRARGLSSNR